MAKKKAPLRRKTSTALARRPAVTRVRISDPTGALPVPVGQLGELATVGALGLAELKLTAEEERVLSEPVNPAAILLKPKVKGGPPEIPYLPHIVYTRWFNRAFGRTGWSIVPTAAPKKADNLVLVPYLLYIHGVPVAAATGEQEYYESNKQQTYGDVIESTVASALRRCAKRLGVGLEMWDKAWLAANVKLPPKGRQSREPEVYDAEPVPSEPFWPKHEAAQTQGGDQKITKEQRARLKQIVERTGRNATEVGAWLRRRFSVVSSADLLRRDYDAVCRALEARGPLVFPGDGQ